MPTLTKLLNQLADQYDTSKRPNRYFDVSKRGNLSDSEIRYVKKRFKELVDREECVKSDPDNPKCYEKVTSDKSPKKKKRKSSYLADYEEIFRDSDFDIKNSPEYKRLRKKYPKVPAGLTKIATETGLPILSLKEVYDIGVGAYASSGSRTGMSASQWGYGRVYAFIMSYFFNNEGKYSNMRFLQNKTDYHIFEEICDLIFK